MIWKHEKSIIRGAACIVSVGCLQLNVSHHVYGSCSISRRNFYIHKAYVTVKQIEYKDIVCPRPRSDLNRA